MQTLKYIKIQKEILGTHTRVMLQSVNLRLGN
jgi:hypothetical protein